MDDRQLTEEELEAREAERITKQSAAAKKQAIFKPDLKAIRKGPHGDTSPAKSNPTPSPSHVNPALSSHSHSTSTGGGSFNTMPSKSVVGPTSPRGHGDVPAWKRIQMEKEQAERDRLENEAKAREESAKQIKARVATTGYTVNVVDEQTPEFISPRSGAPREVFDPNATPDYVSKPEGSRYERQEKFDPSATPDFVSKPEANRYERQEKFDPNAVPDYVSKPEANRYERQEKFDPSATPDFVTRPTHSYSSMAAAPVSAPAAASKFCPWCGAAAGPGRFCSVCGKETSPAAAPAAAAPAPKPAAAKAPEPFIAPAAAPSAGGKTYPPFTAGALVQIEGGSELPITNLACEVNEIHLRLMENGKRVQVTRIVTENGRERRDVQSFNLPYQVTQGTVSARYGNREGNGTLRLKFLRPTPAGSTAVGEHEVTRFLIPGQPGSAQQRVAIGIDQSNDFYKFVPGPASPFDTTFTVVLSGAVLEFRSAYAFPEGDGIKSVSGKQSVNLPKAPFLEQIETQDLGARGKAVVIWHQPRGGANSEVAVADCDVHVVLV